MSIAGGQRPSRTFSAAPAAPVAAARCTSAAREEPDLLLPLLEGVEPSEVSYSAGNGDTLIALSAKHDRPDLVGALTRRARSSTRSTTRR